jgi:hypothetical protein
MLPRVQRLGDHERVSVETCAGQYMQDVDCELNVSLSDTLTFNASE